MLLTQTVLASLYHVLCDEHPLPKAMLVSFVGKVTILKNGYKNNLGEQHISLAVF